MHVEEGLIVYKVDIRTFFTVKLLFTLLFIMIITTVSLMPLELNGCLHLYMSW